MKKYTVFLMLLYTRPKLYTMFHYKIFGFVIKAVYFANVVGRSIIPSIQSVPKEPKPARTLRPSSIPRSVP